MSDKVLVTGDNGYIGSVLCKSLLNEGFDVVGIDSDFFADCIFLPRDYEIKHIRKDVREINKQDLEGMDHVIHLAALSNDPLGALNPELTRQINYLASVRLARLSKDAGVKRFVFSSSCSVYGFSENFVNEEGDLNPATAYAKSKIDSEKEISKLADQNFSPIFLRNATVYGISPMLRVDLVANNLAAWGFTTGRIKIMSDGTPWRPLIHVQDLCRAFIAVLKSPRDKVHNQVFNVGQNSENYMVRQIAEAVKEAVPNCSIEFSDKPSIDSRTYRVDFSKLKNTLGKYFRPTWDIKEGAEDIYNAYKEVQLTSSDFLGSRYTRLKHIENLLNSGRLNNSLFWQLKIG